jgi:hypothetical protein
VNILRALPPQGKTTCWKQYHILCGMVDISDTLKDFKEAGMKVHISSHLPYKNQMIDDELIQT